MLLRGVRVFVFFVLLFFVCGVGNIFAIDIYSDDFDFRDDSKWAFFENGGLIDFDDGILVLESFGTRFPVVYSKFSDLFPVGVDVVFETRFKYDSFASMGDGISIGFTGITDYPFFQFSVWQDTDNGSHFVYNDFSIEKYGDCDVFVPYSDLVDRQYWSVDFLNDDWHVLSIKKLGTLFEVYLDDVLLFVTGNDQCLPSNIILGNPLQGGSSSWNTLFIDYLKVYSLVDDVAVRKIVILPGLGASWNGRAMVYNDEVEIDDWKMTPFVTIYDGLIKALEAKGLVEDTDFYVWNYDWRQPVEDIVGDLDGFVNELTDEGETVDLVGHSLGGLVARVWSQENVDAVNKVISLGSPHQGAVAVYDAWNGGKVSDKFDVRSVALNILLQLQNNGSQTKMETVRNYAPVLKDLLPTFDYAKKGRRVVPVTSMESWNDYLLDRNLNVSSILDQLVTMVAVGEQTEEWVKLKRRSFFDKIMGIWPDGRPIRYVYGQGDGTVLAKSAKFDQGEKIVEISSNHGQMVNDLVDEIFDELGLGEVTVTFDPIEDLSSKTIFFVGSPVEMTVECGDDVYTSNLGFVVVDDNNYSECEVSLLAVADGTYHLVVGQMESDWNYFEGEVVEGETIVVLVDPRNASLVTDEINIDWLYSLIEIDLELLEEEFVGDVDLVGALVGVSSRNVEEILKSIFLFRGRTEEMKLSGRVIDNAQLIMMMENEGASRRDVGRIYRSALRRWWQIDNRTRRRVRRGNQPSVFGSMSYGQMRDLVKIMRSDWREGDYGTVMAKAKVILGLVREVW